MADPNKKETEQLDKKLKELALELRKAKEQKVKDDEAAKAQADVVDNKIAKVVRETKVINVKIDGIDKRVAIVEKKTAAVEKKTDVLTKKMGLVTNVLAKNAARAKAMQGQAGKDKTVFALVSSLSTIATSLGLMNSILSKIVTGKGVGAVQVAAPAATTAVKEPSKEAPQEGIFGLLKGLFTNPAVLAAMAGIVYFVLPKEKQEQIKAFLGGFASGLEDAMGKNEKEGLQGFNTVLKTAGIALTTYFGAKMIGGIASAITTTIRIAKLVGVGAKKLGKGGAAALAVGGAIGAAAVMGGKKEEGEEEEGVSPSLGGGPAAPAAESKPSPAGSMPKPSDTSLPKAPPGTSKSGSNVPDNIDIKSVTNVGPGVDLDGLDPAAKKRLAAMAYEYQEKTGKKIQINSAYRDPKKQAELYAKIGPPNAAPPGKSWHEKGLAFDINSADANKASELGLLEKYGFKRPVAKEPWHVELSETRGGPAYADNPAAPGVAVAVVDKGGKPSIPASGKTADKSLVAQGAEGPSSPTAEGIPNNAVAAASPSTTGTQINTMSQQVKDGQRPGAATSVASVDNSTKGGTKKQEQTPQPPIPTPIASRGSLAGFTRHNTAYA